jgi:hypothetical protein
VFLLHSKTAWNDYFPETSKNTFYSQTLTSRRDPSNTGVYVLNCLFRSIFSSSNGGALYCSSSVTYLLVESTSFFSCKTSSGVGGAIYFSNSNNGQCVLYELCGYDCCLTHSNYPQFIYIYMKTDISKKNHLNYSSVSRCVNENSYQTLCLYYGNIRCPSVNISNNRCYGDSILCYPSSISNSVTCSYSYSTFEDNTVVTDSPIIFWTTGAECEIKSCNILRNTQGNVNTRGTITTRGNTKISDCCILDNNANNIFFQASSSSYTITLLNCTVDRTTNNGYLTIQNTVTKSFILALNHMSTQNCHSEYDAAGTLIPVIQTPSPSKKQVHCFTGQNIFLLIRNEDVVSLISILIFNFIYLSL